MDLLPKKIKMSQRGIIGPKVERAELAKYTSGILLKDFAK